MYYLLFSQTNRESCWGRTGKSREELIIGGGTRIRTGDKGFADLCLTTWLCRPSKYRVTL